MKLMGIVFLMSLAGGLQAQAQEGTSRFDMQIGSSRFHIYLGAEMVDQKTDALLVALKPNGMISGDSIIKDGGGAAAFAAIAEQAKAQGSLASASVQSAEVAAGQRLQAGIIFNVDVPNVQAELTFNSLEELSRSKYPIPADILETYREFIIKNQTRITELEMYKGTVHVGSELSNLREERSAIIDALVHTVSYDNLVKAVYRGLNAAAERGVKSISMTSLGFGAGHRLNMNESFSAMATALQLHQTDAKQNPGSNAIGEVRIVMYSRDNAQNIEAIEKNFAGELRSGDFLKRSIRMMPQEKERLSAALKDFEIAHDILQIPVLKPKPKSRGILEIVGDAIGVKPRSGGGTANKCVALFAR